MIQFIFTRVGKEGYNISLVGKRPAIAEYIHACRQHWSFKGLDLELEEQQNDFFKPTRACLCAFQDLSVKTVEEIVPLHEPAWQPSNHSNGHQKLHYLSPSDFHYFLLDLPSSAVVLDVRNHYESRIGSFRTAIQPPTRRFSEFKVWLGAAEERSSPQIVTYCTGGIRCEKAGRYIAADTGSQVYTLKGGIEAYLAWIRREVSAGRMKKEESLFQGHYACSSQELIQRAELVVPGRNFVFDARGSTGIEEDVITAPQCSGLGCNSQTWRLGHCSGIGCNIILSVCSGCDRLNTPAWCCDSCQDVSRAAKERGNKRRGTCACENNRQAALVRGGVM